MPSHSLWSQLQRKLQQQLAPEEYSTWFRPLRVRTEGNHRLVLIAPNERFLSTLEESYRPAVDRAIAGLAEPGFEILFALEDSPLVATSPVLAGTQPAFNPKYRFDNFVVGNSNQFAHAAARAVADRPSASYNPLFLYGGVGLGKTHLLHAIGHQILTQHPQLRVLYLAAEQFVNELINSIRFDRMPAFRERYRTIDALLIDDVQFIANKERTQEEFFHTFNTLYTSQKQIILSSDSSPKDIPTLEERLRSRFQWGLIADIQQPDLETKVAILRRKADVEGIDLPNDVADFVAQQVKSNIRELEGLLNRVIAFSSLTGKPLSLDLARETLKDILPHEGRKPTAAEIIKSVARHYGLKVVEIKSKNNSKQISFPRQVAMYLCKRLTDLSYPEIGKQFNDKHHSTVMYSVDKIQQLRHGDQDLERVLHNLERGLS
ncbi:MAG TPA: chromosomal replication initiator protein DnaA [Thermoanaerobaculia bacterium]|nr:chromosomal replication initiator protein DnaA [Thermoanaerobaculia bacterium]